MAERVRVFELKPNPIVAQRAANMRILGEEFQNGATISVAGLAPAATYVSPTELRTLIPNSLTAGRYNLQITNVDGGRSNLIELEVEPLQSAAGRLQQREIDVRDQPLPPPLVTREYPQRVLAGNQFAGKIPDTAQGTWGDVSGPTQGGRWFWSEDVIVKTVEFRTGGVEPTGRTAGSGIYHKVRGGPEIFVIDYATIFATKEFIYSELNLYLKQGDELIAKTFGATLEQIVIPYVEIDRPYL